MASGRSEGVLALFSRRDLGEAEISLLSLAAVQVAGEQEARPAPALRPGPEPHPTLAEIERVAIERVLERTRGRVSGADGAAKILGLHPSTLTSRMIKLGVRRTGWK